MDRSFSHKLIPPGINDERTRALVDAFAHAASEFDFTKLLMRNSAEILDDMLELAIHDYSLSEFIGPDGLPTDIVRGLIDRAWMLHEKQGTDEGVMLGQSLIGYSPVIKHWWQEEPKGLHDTHKMTVYVTRQHFDDEPDLLNAKAQRAALKMNDATKRWSQDTDLHLGVGGIGHVGAASAQTGLSLEIAFGSTPVDGDIDGGIGAVSAQNALSFDVISGTVPIDANWDGGIAVTATQTGLNIDSAIGAVL